MSKVGVEEMKKKDIASPSTSTSTSTSTSNSSDLKEKARALIELGRLKFLAYSPIMYTIGAIISCLCDGKPFRVKEYFIGIGIVYGLHSMTHFFNEYMDFDTDTINAAASPWTGGSQVLVKGLLPRKTALYAGIFLIASVGMIVMSSFHMLVYHVYAVYVAVLGMLLAGQYSLPPIRASRRCMGELWVTLVLNFMCPLESYLLQHNDVSSSPFPSHVFWKCLIPIGIVEYVRMMVMNMNDMAADEAVNKITVPVYLGLNMSAKVHNIGMGLAYLALLIIYYFFNENVTGTMGIPTSVMLLLLCTAPYAYHYSRLLHKQPFRYELPYYASQHNCACMLAVYLGLFVDGIFIHPAHSDRIGLLFTKQYGIALLFPMLVLIPSLPILFRNIKRSKFD